MTASSGIIKSRSGMALLELVVALAVAGAISLLGMRLLFAQLEQAGRAVGQRQQAQLVAGLRGEIERAWDGRLVHADDDSGWLDIVTIPHADGQSLQRMAVRIAGDAGEIRRWELRRAAGMWTVLEADEASGQPARMIRQFPFDQSILVSPGALSRRAGEPPPPHLQFRFPEAGTMALRQGFAIFSRW